MRSPKGGEQHALAVLAHRAGVAYAPNTDVLLVAVDRSDRPAGWAGGTFDARYPGPGAPVPAPHGYLQAVVVDTDHQRHGIGRALVKSFVAAAAQSGVGWVFAVPDEDQGVQGRVAFFAACGLAPVHDPDEEWPVMGIHPT
ncbi:GNAT family N-acetyltransferase [Nocardiopsis sp. NPDC055879]